jgi:hypothetical protein
MARAMAMVDLEGLGPRQKVMMFIDKNIFRK